jgi:hypothetical protein
MVNLQAKIGTENGKKKRDARRNKTSRETSGVIAGNNYYEEQRCGSADSPPPGQIKNATRGPEPILCDRACRS